MTDFVALSVQMSKYVNCARPGIDIDPDFGNPFPLADDDDRPRHKIGGARIPSPAGHITH